jgi:hypothetical protein
MNDTGPCTLGKSIEQSAFRQGAAGIWDRFDGQAVLLGDVAQTGAGGGRFGRGGEHAVVAVLTNGGGKLNGVDFRSAQTKAAYPNQYPGAPFHAGVPSTCPWRLERDMSGRSNSHFGL